MSDAPPDDLPALLADHQRFLRAVARRLVRDEDRAEDLIQDTCLAALTAGSRPRGSLPAWLAGIARNLARMAARSAARRKRRELRALAPPAEPGPAETAARLETEERLLRAVRALPEPYRTALVARYLGGRSAAGIARDAGMPASTIRTRIERALRCSASGSSGRSAVTAGPGDSPSSPWPSRPVLSSFPRPGPSRRERRS